MSPTKKTTTTLDPFALLDTADLIGVGEWGRVLRKPSPVMRGALAACADLPQALGPALRFQHLDRDLRARRTDDELFEGVLADLASRLRSGEEITATEMIGAVSDAQRRMVGDRVGAMTERLRIDLVGTCTDALWAGANAMREHLHGHLLEVLDEARSLDVREIRTAEMAIAAGRADDYRRLTALAATLHDIRDAQNRIDHSTLGGHMLAAPVTSLARTMRGAASLPGFSAWEPDAPTTGPWPDLASRVSAALALPWLVWLATTDQVQAWVPTAPQIDDEARIIAAARAAQRDDSDIVPAQHIPSAPGYVTPTGGEQHTRW